MVPWGAVGCQRTPVPSLLAGVLGAGGAATAAWSSEVPGAPRHLSVVGGQGARAADASHSAFKHPKSFHADKKPHYGFKWF